MLGSKRVKWSVNEQLVFEGKSNSSKAIRKKWPSGPMIVHTHSVFDGYLAGYDGECILVNDLESTWIVPPHVAIDILALKPKLGLSSFV